MKFEAATADTRFDQTGFSNEIIDGRSLSLTATYTCPSCSERVGFSRKNFEQRARRQVSNLAPLLQRAFNEWASQNGEAGNPFLDWHCPGCALAVRVYAHPWPAGATVTLASISPLSSRRDLEREAVQRRAGARRPTSR